jgi:hypothetical protein
MKSLLALLAFLAFSEPALAQQTEVNPCVLIPATAGSANLTPGCSPVTSTNPLPVNQTTPATPGAGNTGFPLGATPVQAFATGTTAGTTATLPAALGKFTYLCWLHVEVGSATAAIPVNVTASNLQSGTFTSSANAPVTAATATAGPIINQVFTPCLPASAVNTTIPVAAGALGAGGVNQLVNAGGYQQ